MAKVQVRFVTCLQTDEVVAQDCSPCLRDSQSEVVCVVEWDTWGIQDDEVYNEVKTDLINAPKNHRTLTSDEILFIIYKISGVNSSGGVCV